MSIAAATDMNVPVAVTEFLRRHQAEAEFEKVCGLVRDCYPDLVELNCWLQHDPDEDNRAWCVIGIILPADCSQEVRLQQLHRYHERLVAEVSADVAQLFGLWSSTAAESK